MEEVEENIYKIESSIFVLYFYFADFEIQIRNIKIINPGKGIGEKIIGAIHSFSDDLSLEVSARDVLDTAVGFWKKMGYEESSYEGLYYRVG